MNTDKKIRNVVIIGAGISGLTAAIYNARANLSPLVICGPEDGGQLTLTTEVENFPGFEHGIQGPELVATCKKQAQRFGAEFMTDYVQSVAKNSDGTFTIKLSSSEITAKAIILSTGASARWLGIPSEKQYKGRGVSTCATCDGFFYKNKEILVVGGGDSAMEEATFLTKFASKVTLVVRSDKLRASKIMQDKFFANKKCTIVWNKQISEVIGDGKKVTGAKLKDSVTGAITDITCDGIFLAIGHVPNTSMIQSLVDVDASGYVVTDRFTQTKTKGLFACGDVQDPVYRQAITAAGSGCAAAIQAERYLSH
ncbi:MAG TPA: thioredoxin-disulfide reductase [Acidobacteriota bacterium]|nr:thioredoxin-disulfide reductase [Acidobacteriota bacterium]